MFLYEDSKIVSVCPIFVNISPTLVIDTSMERSSRVLRHANPKILFYFQKRSKLSNAVIIVDLYEMLSPL